MSRLIFPLTRYSPWSLNIEHNDVLAACKELNIPIAAYSPLGRGFLTGQLRSPDDLEEGDHRKALDRFKVEIFSRTKGSYIAQADARTP